MVIPLFVQHLPPDLEEVVAVVSGGLGVDKELLRVLMTAVHMVAKSHSKQGAIEERGINMRVGYASFNEREKSEKPIGDTVDDTESYEATSTSETISIPFLSRDSLNKRQEKHLIPPNAWMIAKSTWQRFMRYMQEEKSSPLFTVLFPVKIIDRIFSLGDKINLVSSLTKKLEPDFALFLASEISPSMGPLKDFESLCNFVRNCRMGEICDYFSSVGQPIHIMSYLISEFLQGSAADEALSPYIESTSFNNTELNFHKADTRFHGKTATSDAKDRRKRNALENAVNSYTGHTPGDFQEAWAAPQDLAGAVGEAGGGGGHRLVHPTSTTGFESQEPQFESQERLSDYGNVLSRQGYGVSGYGASGYGASGYGASGYGSGYVQDMSVFNPYIIMGSLALGLLLGFVVLPAIGDAIFSSVVERVRRDVRDITETGRGEVLFPPSLTSRWTSDPNAGEDLATGDEALSPEDIDEDDVVGFLNGLWRVYRDTNESSCVRYHLCGVLANSTARRLTGKDSGVALLM